MNDTIIRTHAAIQSLEASGAWLLAGILRSQLAGTSLAKEKEDSHVHSSRSDSSALPLSIGQPSSSDSLSEREAA